MELGGISAKNALDVTTALAVPPRSGPLVIVVFDSSPMMLHDITYFITVLGSEIGIAG